ncbi:hypothetical protein FACS189449_10770 [Alphaproteobacteria bacterium]|nr:hypothetical protein FACS189449_10770 [Alphaproteobacteria bacterium]
MKKVFVCSLLFAFGVFFSVASSSNSDVSNAGDSGDKAKNLDNGDDFLELSEPERIVSGAYWGVGLGWSRISHKLSNIQKVSAGSSATPASTTPVEGAGNRVDNIANLSSSASQYDLSLIAGFGAPFYKNYYAGIEFSMFKRFGQRKKDFDGEDIGIKHSSTMGLDMDVRVGYLFPENGNLLYATIGFARVLGRVTLKKKDANPAEVSFGSFYPTFGVGVEHKVDHNWSIRGDFRMCITSKDDGKSYKANKTEWKFDAKPSRYAFRISVTRSI